MKKSFVVAELSNFKFSKMSMRKRYTNISEMIDIIMDDDSNDEYDLGDDFCSTDESDLEYVEENLTNEAFTEPESVQIEEEQHQQIDKAINEELNKQTPQPETDEEVVLSNNSNTDQSDIDENPHAGRYPVHEIMQKRARIHGKNRATPAPCELPQRGMCCWGGKERHDGFDDGHAQ